MSRKWLLLNSLTVGPVIFEFFQLFILNNLIWQSSKWKHASEIIFLPECFLYWDSAHCLKMRTRHKQLLRCREIVAKRERVREIESFLHCGNSALPRKCFFERKGGGGAPRERKSKNYEIALCFIAIARALASCRVVIRLTFSPVFFTPSPLFLELQSVIFAAYSLILIFPIPSLSLAIVWNWFTEKMEYSNVKTGKLNLKGEKKKKKKKKRTHDEMEAGWVRKRRCVLS